MQFIYIAGSDTKRLGATESWAEAGNGGLVSQSVFEKDCCWCGS